MSSNGIINIINIKKKVNTGHIKFVQIIFFSEIFYKQVRMDEKEKRKEANKTVSIKCFDGYIKSANARFILYIKIENRNLINKVFICIHLLIR